LWGGKRPPAKKGYPKARRKRLGYKGREKGGTLKRATITSKEKKIGTRWISWEKTEL